MTEREAAKQIICSLIDVAGGTIYGKMRLMKGFYHAHLEYARMTGGLDLTNHPIVHMTDGPGIDQHEAILRELEQEGRICISTRDKSDMKPGEKPLQIYKLTQPSHGLNNDSTEYAAIKAAYAKVKDKDPEQLKDESHLRSWNITQNGKEQNIQLDLMTDEEYIKFKSASDAVSQLFANAR